MDSCAFRLFLDGNINLGKRVLETPPSDIWLSAIAVEESIRGRLANINDARASKGKSSVTQTYQDLLETIEAFQYFQILLFTDQDEQAFQKLPANLKRRGSNDCRIAVQAISRNIIVLTQNLRDFEAIGVKCEDWSKPAVR